jgi:hypothetical protein
LNFFRLLKITAMKKITALLLPTTLLLLFVFGCEPFDNPDDGDPRDNFVGDWTVNEVSTLYGTTNYSATIIYDPNNSTQVLIKNFYHFGMEIETYAIPTVSSITVPEQTICSASVKGTGYLNKNTIDWTYTVDDGADIDHVTATFTKQ